MKILMKISLLSPMEDLKMLDRVLEGWIEVRIGFKTEILNKLGFE